MKPCCRVQMMYLSAFYNAQLVTICLRFTKHLKPSTLLEGSMMEILILNFPNNRSYNLQPFGQACGNYFLTGVKVKNHLFDMTEVSIFDPNLKF